MKRTVGLLSFACLLFLLGCKKSESNSCSLSSSTIAGAYIMTAYTYQAKPSSPIIDDFSSYQQCEKDDIITLKADGTYTWSEGATACSPSQVLPPGTWSLSGNTIKVDGSAGNVSFDCKTLVIKTTDNTDIETTTLVKQ